MDDLSCQKVIGRACFQAYPAFARRAIAYRLLHLLIPSDIAKILPKSLSDPLIAPGVKIPLDAKFPPGTCIVPGCSFPAGWDPDQDPPECAKSAPLPTLAMQASGGNPPTYLAPGPSGPLPVQPPAPPPVEPVTVYITSSIKDGHVRNDDADWATAKGTGTGNVVDDDDVRWTDAMAANYWSGVYNVYRSFFYFNLSAVPAGKTITEVVLLLTEHVRHETGVAVYKGTQAATLTTADFGAFEGAAFKSQAFVDGENEFILNAAGIQYMQDNIGSEVKLCCRESDYDAGTLVPPASSNHRNGCYYANHSTEIYKPKIKVTYI